MKKPKAIRYPVLTNKPLKMLAEGDPLYEWVDIGPCKKHPDCRLMKSQRVDGAEFVDITIGEAK